MNLSKILTDCFTGPDGKTIAIGRVYSLFALFGGLTPLVASVVRGQLTSLTDYGVGFVSVCTGVMILVTGTNPTEPKGP